MLLLAANDPVNTKPMSVIVISPATCQVTDLRISLVVVSMSLSPKELLFPLAIPDVEEWTFCEFAA